ncbi:MAG: hypothetical protein ABIV48_04900 [Pyrinomonadaceae bacterium]
MASIGLRFEADQDITLHFGTKIPGTVVNMGSVDMGFNYLEHLGEQVI